MSTAHIVMDVRVTQGGYPGIGRATEEMVLAMPAGEGPYRLSLLYQTGAPLSPALRTAARRLGRLLPIDAPLRSLRDQWETPLRLRQVRADLFHATYYACALKPGVPAVLTLYDLIPEQYPHYWPPLERMVIRQWMRAAARGARRIIAPSQATAADLKRLYALDDARLTVAPLAASDWTEGTDTKPQEDLGDRPFLLCVCTNKPHKNLPRLVAAYQRMACRVPAPPTLVIAGGWDPRYPGAEAAALECNQAASDLRVHLIHGPTDPELRWLYRHAHAFVFPSLYEGFGLPVLEAMRSGLAVAASHTPAVAEVTGDAALLFDPLSEESISGALQRLIEEPGLLARLAAGGRVRGSQFSWRATAERILAAYEAALC